MYWMNARWDITVWQARKFFAFQHFWKNHENIFIGEKVHVYSKTVGHPTKRSYIITWTQKEFIWWRCTLSQKEPRSHVKVSIAVTCIEFMRLRSWRHQEFYHFCKVQRTLQGHRYHASESSCSWATIRISSWRLMWVWKSYTCLLFVNLLQFKAFHSESSLLHFSSAVESIPVSVPLSSLILLLFISGQFISCSPSLAVRPMCYLSRVDWRTNIWNGLDLSSRKTFHRTGNTVGLRCVILLL